MEPALIGLAGASASKVGDLLERTTRAAARPFSAVLHAAADVLSPAAVSAGQPASPTDELAQRIQEDLALAGVELTEPLELALNRGKLEVVGEHPQKTLIEAALAQDPGLAGELRELIASHESWDAASLPDANALSMLFSQTSGPPRLEFIAPE